MKKQKTFVVVAYETKRLEMIVYAKDEDEAKDIACDAVDVDWQEDNEYYDFSVASVEELKH